MHKEGLRHQLVALMSLERQIPLQQPNFIHQNNISFNITLKKIRQQAQPILAVSLQQPNVRAFELTILFLWLECNIDLAQLNTTSHWAHVHQGTPQKSTRYQFLFFFFNYRIFHFHNTYMYIHYISCTCVYNHLGELLTIWLFYIIQFLYVVKVNLWKDRERERKREFLNF